MTTRIARLYASASQVARLAATRGYAAAASKPEAAPETDNEAQAESSSAAQRRSNARDAGERSVEKPRRRRGPNALSLLRAQRFAQALQDSAPPSTTDIPSGSPFTGSGPEGVKAAPTLADLEARRPTRPPPPLDSRRYPKVYKKLYDGLDEAFLAKQLLKLAGPLGVRPPKGRGKALAIEGILKTWGWPPPLPPQQPKLREVTMDREWMLSRAQLWLLFRTPSVEGKGEGMMDQGVTFSVVTPQGDQSVGRATVLNGTGTAQALETLDDLINDRLAAIEQHTRTLSMEHDPSLLGVISGASGAYVESEDQGALRISAGSDKAAEKAVSLLTQAAHYASTRQLSASAIVVPSTGQYMALYPHLPSPTGSIPWQELGRASRPLFRLKGVQPWETKVGPRETAHMAEKLDQAPGHLLGSGPGSKTLSELIGSRASNGDATIVRFGHLVYPDDRPAASTLSPPLTSRLTLADIPQSDVLAGEPVFLPSLPASLIHFPLNEKLRIERRLRYRSSSEPGRILELSHTRAVKVAEVATSDASPPVSPQQQESGWKGELDDMLARLDVGSVEEEHSGDGVESGAPAPAPGPSPQSPLIDARILIESGIDIMMPDRPTDVHVVTSTAETTSPDLPDTVTAFLTSSDTGVQSPASLEIEGVQWELVLALELEMTESDISGPTPELDPDLGLGAPSEKLLLRTIKATDLTFGAGRSVRYAELETQGPLSPAFWTELAKITRVLAPGAGALRHEIF